MNKTFIALVGMSLLSGSPLIAETTHSETEYCLKHCRMEDLRKEVKSLEATIEKDKTSARAGESGKIADLRQKINAAREHLARHEKELAATRVELDKAEADFAQLKNR